MKAKELAEELIKNPDSIVCVYDGSPNDTWVEARGTMLVKDEYCEIVDGITAKYVRVPEMTQLYF